MDPTDDRPARDIGKVYVLRPYDRGRDFIPYKPNAAAVILRRLDACYHFEDRDARAWLDKREDPEEVRSWCRDAWRGLYLPRTSDTWERVFPALREREDEGGTGAEIADAVGLKHGAVSAALSEFAKAEVARRLRSCQPT